MGLLGRFALGVTLGVCLGIIGNIAGWFTAFSVPQSLIDVPFMALLTGLGVAVGSFLGWRVDLDGNSNKPRLPMLILVLLSGIGGALLGFLYGSSDEGTRVWRYPVTQATILGGTICSNLAMLALDLVRSSRLRHQERHLDSSAYFSALRGMSEERSHRRTEEN